MNNRSKKPKDYVKQIENALKNQQKCRLIISRSGLYDTNMRCVVSEFETKDKGGEPRDMHYSITLKEYKNYSSADGQYRFDTAGDSGRTRSANNIRN